MFILQPHAWQLQLFKKTLKKKIKLNALKKHFGDMGESNCLLITNGDNNGALNFYLREFGGNWTWADLMKKNITEMEELLEQPVHHISETRLDFSSSNFHFVVTIDVHEHLQDPESFNKELIRVLKKGGKIVVTTPSNSDGRFITNFRNRIGMTKEVYGHVREGYNIEELNSMFRELGLMPCGASEYSRFFTEFLELILNAVYVKGISRNQRNIESIAPTTKNQLKSVSKFYQIYSFLYPILWIISKMDRLLFFEKGYAVIVEAQKT
jgi:SAM-dependent methyltransferase